MKKGLLGVLLGTSLAFTGCDLFTNKDTGDKILDETKIEGEFTVKIIKTVYETGSGNYRLEIHDSEDNLIINYEGGEYLRSGTKIVHNNGKTYTVNGDGNRYYEDTPKKTKEKSN